MNRREQCFGRDRAAFIERCAAAAGLEPGEWLARAIDQQAEHEEAVRRARVEPEPRAFRIDCLRMDCHVHQACVGGGHVCPIFPAPSEPTHPAVQPMVLARIGIYGVVTSR